MPTIDEQIIIADKLDALTVETKRGIALFSNQIEQLTELRTRLISDVVTGQIDVRDVEIPAFEYTPETDDNGEDTDDEESDDMAEEGV